MNLNYNNFSIQMLSKEYNIYKGVIFVIGEKKMNNKI